MNGPFLVPEVVHRTLPVAFSAIRVGNVGHSSDNHRLSGRFPAIGSQKGTAQSALLNGNSVHNGHTPGSSPIKLNEYLIEDARHLGSLLQHQPIIDVTVTSPPYWDVKDYGGKGQIGYGQSLQQYLDDLVSVFSEIWHCTKRTGSLWIVINTVKKDSTLHLLPFKLADRLTSLPTAAWYLQDILVWVKPHTLPWSHKQKLQDHFEYVLCFSKSKSFSLNIDALRSTQTLANWWVKYPERYHPLGKCVNNVWEIHIPTQGSWGNGSMDHACPLPTELTKRIIQLSTDQDGLVFDPFAGTGASVVAAQALGRKWLATDINHRYREMCYKRLAEDCAVHSQAAAKTGSLRDTNLSLRQLKYPVLLYKRLAPGLRLTVEDVPLLAVRRGSHLKQASPNWVSDSRVVIAVRNGMKSKQVGELVAAIEDRRLVPPLSKFQIDADVRVMRQEEFEDLELFSAGKKINVYTCGHFWRAARETSTDSIGDLSNKSKFPLLVSDICVDEQPAY